MPTTALYAGLLAIILVALSLRVIAVRRGQRISLGDGGNVDLLRRIRSHANFTEYAPMAILLMALAESLKAPAILLHVIGLAFVAGRLSHAYGFLASVQTFTFRILGMQLTLFSLLGLAATCLWFALMR